MPHEEGDPPGEPDNSSSALGLVLPLLAIVGASAVAILALIISGRVEDDDPVRARGLLAERLPPELRGAQAPTIDLLDGVSGRRVDTSRLEGPYLVTFLYTNCPDLCPLIGQEIRTALAQLRPSEAAAVTALAVSVDPAGDTPATVAEWADNQRMPAGFGYLVGSERELKPVWREWFVLPQDEDKLNVSLHTASIWLVDGEGRLRARYSGGSPIDPGDLASDLRTLVEEEPPA